MRASSLAFWHMDAQLQPRACVRKYCNLALHCRTHDPGALSVLACVGYVIGVTAVSAVDLLCASGETAVCSAVTGCSAGGVQTCSARPLYFTSSQIKVRSGGRLESRCTIDPHASWCAELVPQVCRAPVPCFSILESGAVQMPAARVSRTHIYRFAHPCYWRNASSYTSISKPSAPTRTHRVSHPHPQQIQPQPYYCCAHCTPWNFPCAAWVPELVSDCARFLHDSAGGSEQKWAADLGTGNRPFKCHFRCCRR